MTKKNKKEKSGFTLVETLVAIAILLLAVAAPLSLANKSLNSSALSKQQITASFLAQEAMEYIRNARDENVLKYNDWLKNGSNIKNECVDGKCQVDAYKSKMKKCSGVCEPLKYKDSLFSIDGDPNDNSLYTQTVEITQINSYEIAVKVTVSWQGTNGVTYEVIARENLTNWQQ